MPDSLTLLYDERRPLLDCLRENLETETMAALSGLKHIDRVSFRVKDTDRFTAKAKDRRTDPPYQHPLVEIEDQVAGRVIVFFLSDLETVADRLKGTFTTIERTHKRPAKDEEFSYESYHLICIIPPHMKPDGWVSRTDLPHTFELQIRTIFMHAYAEPQHNIGYKTAQELPREIRRELAWIAASAWGGRQGI